MTPEEAIQHLKESLADPTHEWGCEECKQEHEQLLEWLEDYKRLQSVNSWIPCSERMPDAPGIHVMVTDGVHIMESLYEVIDGEILWLDNSLDLRFGKVTHWMPLPEMPKGV